MDWARRSTLLPVSTAEGWDLTVPEDAGELLAELRRHGVEPGQRLRVVAAPDDGAPASDQRTGRRRFRFAGTLQGAEPDLASDTDRYLEQGFGRQ